MTFFDKITTIEKEIYAKYLQLIGALSGLYSDSEIPFLYYRVHENIFCKVFSADNLSRSDISIDCKKNNWGIGLKTFSSSSSQKIAEFNKALDSYQNLSGINLVNKIQTLRNGRLQLVKDLFGNLDLMYHNAYRIKDKIVIFEEPITFISDEITIKNETSKSIIFFDNVNKHEYNFNRSKSTLLKKFIIDKYPVFEIPIKMVSDPFELLLNLDIKLPKLEIKTKNHIILPLYSWKDNKKIIPEKSGLNQWNAGGRQRNPEEVYIPIPAVIHQTDPNFLPERDVVFELELPNKKILNVKICQDGGKALMSNPNKALGKWILQDLLHIKNNKLVAYDDLLRVGFDSIALEKINDNYYKVDFKNIDSYETFLQQNKVR